MLGVLVLAAALMGCLASPVRAQDGGEARSDARRSKPAPFLAPGDVVRVRIWREPELSGDFEVDERGTVVLPKLGAMKVDSIAPDSLRTYVTNRYAVYLNNPSIEITTLRRISILGAVRNPGLYPVNATMRLSDILALAGGVTPDGKPDHLDLYRDGKKVDVPLQPGTRLAEATVRSGDQLFVPQKSWLSRNPWFISTMIGAVVTTAVALAN